MLKIQSGMSMAEISLALETARLMGFASEAADFPIAGADGDTPPAQNLQQLEDMWTDLKGGGRYAATAHNPDVIFDTDFRSKKGLETIFSKGEFLKDADCDFFSDTMNVKIKLDTNPDASAVVSACNMAFRLGMETVAFDGAILADKSYSGNVIEFIHSHETKLEWHRENDRVKAVFYGKGKKLEQFSSILCEKFPLTDCIKNWSDVLCGMTDSFAMKNPDGQLAFLEALGKEKSGADAFVSPEMHPRGKAYFKDVKFHNFKAGRQIYTKEYDIPWETDTFETLLETKLYPNLKAGDTVEICAALSEDIDVRKSVADKISTKLVEIGVKAEKIQVIDAYKQGLCWISEVVIPQLEDKNADKLEIYFKPFLPKGQTEWLDENGATPNKIRTLKSTPDKWFDLPIRYLQELYPVEDIIVSRLGIHRDNVVFRVYEGSEDITYICRAYNGADECYGAEYKAVCSERPFMDEYPQLGAVHPSTGYLKAVVNGKVMVDENIKTDLENVWDIYQSQVLPECKSYVEQKYGDGISAQNQPFFQQLHLDITLSETEYRTGSREDMVSSLNALHEDLYFTGTDYFKYFGQAKGCGAFDAPGLILPDIHKEQGKPKFKVTLYDLLRECPAIEKEGAVLAQQKSREGINLYISALSPDTDGLCVTIKAEGVEDNLLCAYANLYAAGVLDISDKIENTSCIHFVSDSGSVYTAYCKPAEKSPKNKKITDIPIPQDRVIGYEEYTEIVKQLEGVENLQVFPVATSYEGRTVYAIWLKKPHSGYLSMTKYLTNRPSEYINARHHANEVSSTNAAFMLIKELLTDKKYADICDKMNLVIIPVENVDGTAIHYRLQKEHPNWKYHTARFNAIGKEFCGECYTTDPVSTEALAATRVYHKFIPDIMVDNHGVPSHEWEQQFSGYTSPAYKGFWLPRALLYGYFWYAKEERYSNNIPINKKMEDVIADAVAQDKEMAQWNKNWTQQFEKYAHAWMPKLFPASYYKGMINYWIPFPHDPNHIYAAIRYPWVTGVAYTSEVADETAQGEYLALCAKAHLTHDIATIDMILNAKHNFSNCVTIGKNGTVSAAWKRLRPMEV